MLGEALGVKCDDEIFAAREVIVESAFGEIDPGEYALHGERTRTVRGHDLPSDTEDAGFAFGYLMLFAGYL
ncbi:hypothetical protein ASA1KI_39050 [Opitutales bacterium ASA1]|nr:hypothetical protein ASA1KI_39050 [Opitutales bacterium ASA1]